MDQKAWGVWIWKLSMELGPRGGWLYQPQGSLAHRAPTHEVALRLRTPPPPPASAGPRSAPSSQACRGRYPPKMSRDAVRRRVQRPENAQVSPSLLLGSSTPDGPGPKGLASPQAQRKSLPATSGPSLGPQPVWRSKQTAVKTGTCGYGQAVQLSAMRYHRTAIKGAGYFCGAVAIAHNNLTAARQQLISAIQDGRRWFSALSELRHCLRTEAPGYGPEGLTC
ncbi:unnamed protein product, partial [Iphiclides podalirius]